MQRYKNAATAHSVDLGAAFVTEVGDIITAFMNARESQLNLKGMVENAIAKTDSNRSGIETQIMKNVLNNEKIAQENNLGFDYGALLLKGVNEEDLAVVPNSPADNAGLLEKDLILEINGEKINTKNTLVDMINKFDIGEEVELKIERKKEIKNLKLKIGEY